MKLETKIARAEKALSDYLDEVERTGQEGSIFAYMKAQRMAGELDALKSSLAKPVAV